jgi:hypothetical protein
MEHDPPILRFVLYDMTGACRHTQLPVEGVLQTFGLCWPRTGIFSLSSS